MSEHKLKNCNVLFVSPAFFSYEKEIAEFMRKLGADVDFMPDRPFDSPFMTAVTRVMTGGISKLANRVYRSYLNDFGRSHYDVIFIISGQSVSHEILCQLRSDYPKAKMLLYMFDSFKNRKSQLANLSVFDECFTFDPVDSKEHGIKLRPLFFSSGFEASPNSNFDYHLSFVGTIHTDRYKVLSSIVSQMSEDFNVYTYYFLQSQWVFYLYKLINKNFKSATIDQMQFEQLSREKVQKIFRSSLTIVDVEHANQSGLTMRTIESIGASKKLITTNPSVASYDFYNDNNICIVDRESPKVPNSFFQTTYETIPKDVYNKYKMSSWLDELLYSL